MPPTSEFYYEEIGLGVIHRLSLYIRKKIFDIFMEELPGAANVLDLGATSCSAAPEANFFEKFFPDKRRITAAGVADASYLEKEYPGLKFVAIEPNGPLPFSTRQFDAAFCHAVIEHVIGDEERRFFLDELTRVSNAVFITTPNRNFPIELHTMVPLLHFLCPKRFYDLLDKGKISKFYSRANLDLLDGAQYRKLFEPYRDQFEIETRSVGLFGFTSNLIVVLKRRD